MTNAAFAMPLELNRHSARVNVRPDGEGGWEVSTEVDGREIASDYCPNWQRVERFRARMQEWLRSAEAQDFQLIA